MKTKSERSYKRWTVERRAQHGKAQEEQHQRTRFETGIDPDEDTIYNVLCPAIRQSWSHEEEVMRRRAGQRIWFEFPLIKARKLS